MMGVELVLRSRVPGRIRWELVGTVSLQAFSQIEDGLRELAKVVAVISCVSTSRLLVFHSAEADFESLSLGVRGVVAKVLGHDVDDLRCVKTSSCSLGQRLIRRGVAWARATVMNRRVRRAPLFDGLARAPGGHAGGQPSHECPELLSSERSFKLGAALLAEQVDVGLTVVKMIALGNATDVVARVGGVGGATGVSRKVSRLGASAAAAAAGSSITGHWGQVTWSEVSLEYQDELRTALYRHLQTLEMGHLDELRSGELVALVNEDINEVQRAFDAAWKLAHISSMAGWSFAWLASTSWLIAALTTIPIPLMVALSSHFRPRMRGAHQRASTNAGEVAGRVAGNFAGIGTLRSYLAEERESARVGEASRAYEAERRTAVELSSQYTNTVAAVVRLGMIPTTVGGAMLALRGSMTSGSVFSTTMLIGSLLYNFDGLAEALAELERGRAAHSRVREYFELSQEPRGGSHPSKQVFEGNIEFGDVSFAYTADEPVLHSVSLSCAAGRTTAIVGLTGSGKSTLLKLLLRFYNPDDGHICIGGVDVGEINLQALRSQIAVVSQDLFLFEDTVLANLTMNRKVDVEEVYAAARLARAHEFVMELPQGYETRVGAGGHPLSRGQQQRLAIARAVLKNSPIVVLDEATSSLDASTEAGICADLDACFAGRTVIAITHRLSAVRTADHICVFEQGRVIEQGNHRDLMAAGRRYSEFWSLQSERPDDRHVHRIRLSQNA